MSSVHEPDRHGPRAARKDVSPADMEAAADLWPALKDAESTLAQLAGALFPGGEAHLSQLTWEDAGHAAGDGAPEVPSAQPGSGPEPPAVQGTTRAMDLRYRTLVEQIPAVTFLAVLGEGDNEIYVSPYIESLLGFTQQEWLENPFLWFAQLHPDDRALWHEEFTRGVQTGGPFRAECRFIARDGGVVWVRGEARLVKDELGRPLFLQGVAFDITESKRIHTLELQEAVRSTEQRYRDLVEHLDAIFWEADGHTGHFTFVSDGAEAILGYPSKEWTGNDDFWLTRVHPDDRQMVDRKWSKALSSGGEQEFEFRALDAEGREIWLHTRMQAPVVTSSERYIFGVMLDVTQRKRADEERARLLAAAEEARQMAETANRAKDEFLATMSHELKTPLNALIGYAQLLRGGQMPPEMMSSALESIERNALAQARLVEDLLDVSRFISGKLRLEVRSIDLAEVIDASLDTVRLAARAKQIALASEIDRSGLVISGDPSRLQQVVWNLLSNAVKFTPEGGRIDVRLERRGEFATILVKDTGEGISKEFLPHMFERFRQADNTRTRRHGGLGLGLSIVRQIVEMHGGIIVAESAGHHQGSTFTVELPLSHPGEAADEPAETVSADRAQVLAGVNVLVVDDENDAREVLRMVLSRAGADVVTATSAAEADEALGRRLPDVLICDIGMPEEDGYQLIRRVRASGLDAERLPAVALTAYGGVNDRKEALEAGFQEHVAKPMNIEHIIEVVARVVHDATGRPG